MKPLVIFFVILNSLFIIPSTVFAIENPLKVPNNKFGIHILFPEEIAEAAKLVNSNGGQWGYVTIPIQAGDRDLEKWQNFMDSARKNKVIPLIRLATEGDYFNTEVWRKPTEADVLDFANFLNSLSWPTKNRYIIVFNEVNRANEWGGSTNPGEYARFLSYAVDTFKEKSSDFFIISSGMDNAAATVLGSSFNAYSYLQLMELEVPGIFEKIDGLSSHSYPNPAFSQPPSKQDRMSIATFRHELDFIKQFSNKELPVFITETGWSKHRISEETAAAYLKEAFSFVWNDDKVLAVTPFLLRSGAGLFTEFSFFRLDGSRGLEYKAIEELSKIKGEPVQGSIEKDKKTEKPITAVKKFSERPTFQTAEIEINPSIQALFKWLLKL